MQLRLIACISTIHFLPNSRTLRSEFVQFKLNPSVSVSDLLKASELSNTGAVISSESQRWNSRPTLQTSLLSHALIHSLHSAHLLLVPQQDSPTITTPVPRGVNGSQWLGRANTQLHASAVEEGTATDE